MNQRSTPFRLFTFSRWLVVSLVLLSICLESFAAPLAAASPTNATYPVRQRVRLVSRTDPVDSSKYIELRLAGMEHLGISVWVVDSTSKNMTWPIRTSDRTTSKTATPTPAFTFMPPIAATTRATERINNSSQTIRINFRNKYGTDPAGWLSDTGSVFADRGNGLNYGWDRDNVSNARYREGFNPNNTQFESFIYISHYGAYVWEIALRTGLYNVRLAAGDPKYPHNGTFITTVEGQSIINGEATATSPWLENSAQVYVMDGRLTVTNGNGSRNNLLNFIEISPVTEETAPLLAQTHQ